MPKKFTPTPQRADRKLHRKRAARLVSGFIRTIENFTCEHCGEKVIGNGYTNHCPKCLWSKHVDVHPGDRASSCGGLMEPVRVTPKKDSYVITHRCMKCGYEKNNEAGAEDSIDALVEVAKRMQ